MSSPASSSYSQNLHFSEPPAASADYNLDMKQNFRVLDFITNGKNRINSVYNGLVVTAGAGLTVNWLSGGAIVNGTDYPSIASSSSSATDNTADPNIHLANYVYVNNSGVVTISTTLPTVEYAPMAVVFTNAGSIVNITNAPTTSNKLNILSSIISNNNKIYPAADSTTAIQILKADGTTPVVTVDTINGNVGIGMLGAPTYKLDINGGSCRIVDTIDMGLILQTTGVDHAARIELNSGNGTNSSRYTYIRIKSLETSPQEWNFGMYGLKNFQIRDTTNSLIPITIQVASGNVGIRTDTPTASLHLPAGTTVAQTAPLQFTSGSVETTPRAGLMEYNDRFIVTESDAANRYLVQAAASTKTTAGAPYTNDGYVTVVINGTAVKLMTTT